MKRSGHDTLSALCLAVSLPFVGCAERPALDPPSPPDPLELAGQLQGRSCRYSPYSHETCKIRDSFFDSLWGIRDPGHSCVAGAARCLEKLGPAARPALPALLAELRNGPNDYDTGDGIIPVRSSIAAALAATRDPLAIDPLAQALRDAQPLERSISALPPTGEPAARSAILEALARFGPPAAHHLPEIAALLRQRNANPQQPDHVASSSARALGAFRDSAATPVLIETLANPAAREAAIRALAQLSPPPSAAVAPLLPLLDDQSIQPVVARTLAAIGPPAEPAIPRLMQILRQPSLAVVKGNSIRFSAEATLRSSAKLAAVEAVLAIRPADAPTLLAPFASDPDVKFFLRARLRPRR